MTTQTNKTRRRLLTSTAAGMATLGLLASKLGLAQSPNNGPVRSEGNRSISGPHLTASKQIDAGVLSISYFEAGPLDGPPVILLHGYPYDIQSYAEVAPMLAERGCRVIVPYLRGHGGTRFLDSGSSRAGQQAAIGADVIALIDALKISKAIFAGYDWGGRAACVAAALWPQRCNGLVSVNEYLIQDIAKASVTPLPAEFELASWYVYYYQTKRGRAGLTANRRDIAHILWTHNSPNWHFDDVTFARTAESFENPDYVDIVIHSYRHRIGNAAGFPEYADYERRLALRPVITVPTITLDGDSNGALPATDGTSTAALFGGPRVHRIIAGAGHNLPQEAPSAFVEAVMDLV